MKYILSIILVLLLLIFPQKAYCAESVSISYLEFDNSGGHTWRVDQLELHGGGQSIFDRVEIALYHLFNKYCRPGVYPYAENIDILSLSYMQGCLSVDLSGEFNGFGGGGMLEQIYTGQLVKTLLDIDGIEKVTLSIDGLLGNTPEGIVIEEVTSWQELMEGVITSTE